VAVAAGCEELSPEVLQQREWVRRETDLKRLVGMSRDDVRAAMGTPERTRDDRVAVCWGPQEALWSVLREGDPYEEWVWTDGAWLTYAWFAAPPGTQSEREAWKVVWVAVGRTDVVY
jgi:hypothetical protein